MQAKVRTRGFPGHRRAAGRCAGPGRAGPARLRHGRPGRQGGRRKPRARARHLSRAWPFPAAAAHHRQPLAGRPRQGGQPLRPADRARPAGRDGRGAARKHRGLRRAGRAGARRLAQPRSRRAAGGDRRPRGGARRDLPRGVRRRGRVGWLRRRRCRPAADHRRAFAARPDQSSARPAEARRPRGADRRGSRAAIPTSPRSRARRAPSACSKWRRRAATTS